MAPHFPAYSLVLPGSNSFICRAETCNAWCCRSLSVPLGDGDVERLAAASGLAASRFLECEDGEPIALPLAEPYLLARAGGACALLDGALACSCYAGRPTACRLYPFQLLFADGTGRPGRPSPADLESLAALPGTVGNTGSAMPLLLRHSECPGFTGPPLSTAAWATVLRETALLQYGNSPGANWPEP